MKICIISDLHCKYQLKQTELCDTLLISNKPRIPATQHPVAAMLNSISKYKNLNSDILLCLGDLGDKADEQGIATAWTFVEEIGSKLKARLCIGIPGNHDLNSRNQNGKDALSFIKTFHENFPTPNEGLNIKFWESGYCIVKHKKCIILIINSVHDHYDEEHAKSSSIQVNALEKINLELDKIGLDNYDFKICILHHHPIKHSNINNSKDSDSIEKGDDLLKDLIKYNFNIVIHGHKHQPRIVEYNNLPIFATGSFSSFANLQGTGFNTMFHILELNENTKMGTIESWEYDIQSGWNQNLNSKFPPIVGFGANLDIEDTAKNINDIFVASGKEPMLYAKIVNEIKGIEFLIPNKLIQLGKILNDKYSIQTIPQFPLQPNTINELIK